MTLIPDDTPPALASFICAACPDEVVALRALLAPWPDLRFRSFYDERHLWSDIEHNSPADETRRWWCEAVFAESHDNFKSRDQPYFLSSNPHTGGTLTSPYPDVLAKLVPLAKDWNPVRYHATLKQ